MKAFIRLSIYLFYVHLRPPNILLSFLATIIILITRSEQFAYLFTVSFGGIIGLFLGGSLLSVVELFYYIMVATFSSLRSRQRTRAESRTRTNTPIVHTTVLPILDYGPLKPPARRIPIFANYGLAKSNLNRY